jgi:hypothetical protein
LVVGWRVCALALEHAGDDRVDELLERGAEAGRGVSDR